MSVSEENDASFPGATDAAVDAEYSFIGIEDTDARAGVGNEIFATGDRPEPTAPLPFSATLESAEEVTGDKIKSCSDGRCGPRHR